jgi:DNA polymerase III alpha subunit
MGLRYVKGLGERDWDSIASARHAASFISIDDFVSRTTLDEGVLGTLAEAGVFDGFNVDRRTVVWDASARLCKNNPFPLAKANLFESLSSFRGRDI